MRCSGKYLVNTATAAICFFRVKSSCLLPERGIQASQGESCAAGVDDQSIEEFDGDWENNLYRLWNRMALGSYMPVASAAGGHQQARRKKRRRWEFPLSLIESHKRWPNGTYLEAILEPQFHGDRASTHKWAHRHESKRCVIRFWERRKL